MVVGVYMGPVVAVLQLPPRWLPQGLVTALAQCWPWRVTRRLWLDGESPTGPLVSGCGHWWRRRAVSWSDYYRWWRRVREGRD